jgi:hypothetical protein
MSKVTIAGDVNGTGVFTIASPNSNTNRTITLPDATGTLLSTATPGVPIGGPAFSAYASNSLSITGNTSTKIVLNTELFDTNSCFDSNTNYRFTPTVAGYYQINFMVEGLGAASGYYVAQLKRNNTQVAVGANFPTDATFGPVSAGAFLVQMNGSTDYLELYIQSSASRTIPTGVTIGMNGFLARSAT